MKTHELALVSLQQLGVFDSWTRHGRGTVPGEGAAFLVLEDHSRAIRRRARIYARIGQYALRSAAAGCAADDRIAHTLTEMLSGLAIAGRPALVAAGDGDVPVSEAEREALRRAGIEPSTVLHPKAHLGNTFAAAAAVQVGLAAELASRAGRPTGAGQLPWLWFRDGMLRPGGGMTRVVITGMGIVSPVGIGRETFWSSLTAGRSGIGPITLFDASSFPVRFGGEVKGFRHEPVVASFPEACRQSRSKAPVGPGGGRRGDRRRGPAGAGAARWTIVCGRRVGKHLSGGSHCASESRQLRPGARLGLVGARMIVPGCRRHWIGPL